MAPRHLTNPAPITASAKATAANFYCSLCNKGYSRQNEFSAHESSYEHNHNQRRKDLRSMNSIMAGALSGGSAKGSSSADGGVWKDVKGTEGGSGVKMSLKGSGEKKTFKKSGFKSAFGDAEGGLAPPIKLGSAVSGEESDGVTDPDDSEEEHVDYELYDPEHPVGCSKDCPGRNLG